MTYSEQAIQALQNSNYEAYQLNLEEAILKDLDDDLYLLVDSLFQLGFLQDARRIIERLQESHPVDDQLKINLAEIYIEETQYLDAFNLLSQVEASSPAYPQALLVLADYYQLEGLPEVSEQKLLEARQIMPDEPVIKFALAELYFVMGRTQQAIALYEELLVGGLDDFPGVQLSGRLGAAYSEIGDFENAQAYFEEAVEEKETTDNLFQLAMVYYQKEEYQRSNELLFKVKSLDHTYASLYLFLAKGLEQEQRLQEAFEVVKEGLQVDQTNEQLYALAATISVKLGDNDLAQEYFDQGVALNPENVRILVEYSNFLNYVKDYEANVTLIHRALEQDDIDPQLYWNLAVAQNELENYGEAARAFEKTYPHFSSNLDFLKEYLMFLQEEGNHKKWLEVAQEYRLIEPNNFEVNTRIDQLLESDAGLY